MNRVKVVVSNLWYDRNGLDAGCDRNGFDYCDRNYAASGFSCSSLIDGGFGNNYWKFDFG